MRQAMIWIAGILLVLGPFAVAQASPTVSAPAGPLEIAGKPQECTDFRGRSVQTMQISELGDVGRAWVVNTIPYILIDPTVLRTLPSKLQLFFFSHECAHHVLGHWYKRMIDNEREADCWAIRRGRDLGHFSRQDVRSFAPWLANSGGSRFGHLPGPQRAEYLLKCFDDP